MQSPVFGCGGLGIDVLTGQVLIVFGTQVQFEG
jgi:hypothetical protein